MPTYVWTCEKCEQQKEVVSSIANRDVPPHGADEAPCQHRWRRIMAAPKVILQGGGWAKEGYDTNLKVKMS
jgi:predicted nucleic acid-binding Zn ribbon protein